MTGKIRILHLTSTPGGLGGVERLLLDMAPHYDFDRFSIAHCNLFGSGGGQFPESLRSTELPYFDVPGGRLTDLPRAFRELLDLIRKEQIDVLHLHMVHATIAGSLVALLGGSAKVLISKHYRYYLVGRPLLRTIDRLLTNRADAVAPVSRCIETDLIRHGLEPGRARVIYNGIDLALFDRRSAETPAVSIPTGGGPVLAAFGNLHAVKGHEFLLRAMPDILRSHPSARLLLVGEGKERGRLEALGGSLGIAGAVLMLGFQDNVPALLSRADLCVHPSLDEAFGVALLEAMAARRAVVATKVGGIPEIVDASTGILVPPRDPAALARAVCTLLANPPLRLAMGQAGRARVEVQFTIERTVRSYEALYELLAA